MSSSGLQYLAALIRAGDLSALAQAGDMKPLLLPSEVDAWDFIRSHATKHNALPTPKTVAKHLHIDLPTTDEPESYYLDLVKRRHIRRALKQAMLDVSPILQDVEADERKGLAVLTEAVMALQDRERAALVSDFRGAADTVWPAYKAQWQSDSSGIMLGWPAIDTLMGGLMKGDVASMVGRPAIGKALANGTPVLMADGSFRPVEALAIGDTLASVDGKPSEVFGVYPQGDRALYRVAFSDGRSLDVDGDHLWQVGCKHWREPRVLTTHVLLKLREASRYGRTLYVPTHAGEFGGKRPFLDPYTLGALVGDGGLTGTPPVLTTADPEVTARIALNLLHGYSLVAVKTANAGRAASYRISGTGQGRGLDQNWIRGALEARGLTCRSEAKRLPPEVFLWSRADRVALLQGLMDTDGTVGATTGNVSFGSASAGLVQDVARLVRSLGGKAKIQKPKETTHLDHHRLSLILRDRAEAFGLTRKKALCRAYATHDPARLHIVGIEPIGVDKATCIAVTHPSRLFVAGEYVVTHNTWQMLHSAVHGWLPSAPEEGQEYADPIDGGTRMMVSMEMNTLAVHQRLAAMVLKLPSSKINTGDLNAVQRSRLKDGLHELRAYGNPFWVVDGNLSSTVDQIWALARQLKPDAIYIDGGYLLKHPTEKDRYRRVAENADLIKSMLAPIAPTVVTWQFAKSAAEKVKKKGQGVGDVGLEDIGYSSAIGEVSSLVMGLFEEESIETLARRRVRILKGRKGEVGEFLTKWDHIGMDFSQVQEEALEDMQIE